MQPRWWIYSPRQLPFSRVLVCAAFAADIDLFGLHSHHCLTTLGWGHGKRSCLARRY
jgi:hypothetical protein